MYHGRLFAAIPKQIWQYAKKRRTSLHFRSQKQSICFWTENLADTGENCLPSIKRPSHSTKKIVKADKKNGFFDEITNLASSL